MPLTPEFEIKASRLFEAHDIDDDGYLTGTDYESLAETYRTAVDLDSRRPEARNLQQAFDQWWGALLMSSDGSDERLGPDEFLQSLRSLVSNESRSDLIDSLPKAVFHALDTDRADRVGHVAFLAATRRLNILTPRAIRHFKAMDTDGDGYLSRDELIEAWRKYLVVPDLDHPGGALLGAA
ncbi:EF-hand domain-containing protein [Nocardiopsis alba]|uniref:EF-hand domain-containing protein n=1 Tax=Nocardiopsis alba TaxID=53437 RepID=UPI0033FFE3D9